MLVHEEVPQPQAPSIDRRLSGGPGRFAEDKQILWGEAFFGGITKENTHANKYTRECMGTKQGQLATIT